MSIEENKAVVRRYIEELNQRNASVIDEVIAESLTIQTLHHSPAFTPEAAGREAVRRGYLRNIMAFPDYRVTIEEMLAEGDRVVLYWTNRGTHQGDF
jgi:predicted ester cyclase